MSSVPPKIQTYAHLRPYSGGDDYGPFRHNTIANGARGEPWYYLIVRAPLNASEAHQKACHESAANLRTAALLKLPLLNASGEVNANPSDTQLKAHQDPILHHWQGLLAGVLESKCEGGCRILNQMIQMIQFSIIC